ncbi:hypothetical protein PC123_g10428 [Phytophthora cactorum]|nr:hypothetical protein PC123_g10428 [Phytophthora cactorum]
MRLDNLHTRRPVYMEPAIEGYALLAEQPWPEGIVPIETWVTNGIRFPELGSYNKWCCIGDCFWDSSDNVEAAVYCTPSYRNLNARCSYAPITRQTLNLFDTRLGLYSTTFLDVGDIVGEHSGELSEWSALVLGQSDQSLKQNSGNTQLYHAELVKKKLEYVDGNRRNAKGFVRMIKDVKPGAEFTVNYGNERWFVCACDDCWKGDTGNSTN